jgi:hypothetical protein
MIKLLFTVKQIELWGDAKKFHADFQKCDPGDSCKHNRYKEEDEEVALTMDQAFRYGLLKRGI